MHNIQLVKIQPEERLAASSELNHASSLVTGCDEAWGMGYRAATQVKGLSHEIFIVPEADVVLLTESSTLIADSLIGTWQGDASPAGSKTVARYQTDIMETRETQTVLLTGVCPIKPINGKTVQTTLWESDQFIVPEKQGNACRGKGLAGARWTGKDTPSIPRDGREVSTKLWSITQRAREDPTCKFTSLAHLLTADFLKECFRELKKDKAPGIDGVTGRKYEENLDENIEDLVTRLIAKQYRPQPVKRAYIPKSNGERRPLGIPALEDKIVQLAIKKILEAIFEVDFSDVFHGFRPNRSCHDALDMVDLIIMTKPVNSVVDMDITKFFDTVDHECMMECRKQRVVDPSLLRITFDFLGFTLYCDKTRNGKFKVGRKTSSKKFRQKMKAMNLWLKGV